MKDQISFVLNSKCCHFWTPRHKINPSLFLQVSESSGPLTQTSPAEASPRSDVFWSSCWLIINSSSGVLLIPQEPFFTAIRRSWRQMRSCVFILHLMVAKVAAATFDSDSPRNGNEEQEKRGRQTDESAKVTENRYVAQKQTQKQTRGKHDRPKAGKQKREAAHSGQLLCWNTVPLILYELFIDELLN